MTRRIGIILRLALCAAFAPPRLIPMQVAGPRRHGQLLLSPSEPDGSSALETIRSWLLSRLPDLLPGELELYSACLLSDGYSTPAQLDGINSGASGKVEDLYFMRKGHRQSLMKQIGGRKDGAAGGGNEIALGGRSGEMPTGFSSTEVDGEFALVEEFLKAPPSSEDDAPVFDEGVIKASCSDSDADLARKSATANDALIFIEEGVKAAHFAVLEAEGPLAVDRAGTNGPTERSLSEDERCLRPIASFQGKREIARDHRGPGDSNSLTKRHRASRSPEPAAATAALSQSAASEARVRPTPSSSRDRTAELEAVAGRLGDSNIAKKTDRSPEPAATASLSQSDASLSQGGARVRPAPSSSRDRTAELGAVAGRLGDGNLVKKTVRSPEPAAAAALSQSDASLSQGGARVRPSPSSSRDRTAELGAVAGRLGDGNLMKKTDRSPELSVAASFSQGETRVRPTPSSNGSSEGYFTVNDRTGDARVKRRTKTHEPKNDFLGRATDLTHKNTTRSLPADPSKSKTLARATERQPSTRAGGTPKVLSRATSTRPSSMLADLTRAAESRNAKKGTPDGTPDGTAGAVGGKSLLRSLAEEERAGHGRREGAPSPICAAFAPSSLRLLLD